MAVIFFFLRNPSATCHFNKKILINISKINENQNNNKRWIAGHPIGGGRTTPADLGVASATPWPLGVAGFYLFIILFFF
jgi:hypothetical protein